MAPTSLIGGVDQGVLGATTMAGDITLVSGWDWYYGGNNPIAANQYDFQTVVAHELGHVLGLGESTDPTSVMSLYLNPGQIRHQLTTADLALLSAVYADTPTTPTDAPALSTPAIPTTPTSSSRLAARLPEEASAPFVSTAMISPPSAGLSLIVRDLLGYDQSAEVTPAPVVVPRSAPNFAPISSDADTISIAYSRGHRGGAYLAVIDALEGEVDTVLTVLESRG